MAHEIDMSNRRENVAYVGEVPWHGLGQKLDEDASIETWKVQAGLDWSVIPSTVQFKNLEGEMTEFEGQRVLFRSDTGEPLSVVSQHYHPVQPPQILEFYRDLVEQYKAFKLETAGSLKGGRRIWALAKATDEFHELAGGDRIERYLLLATSFDKMMATIVQQTSVRVVCNNTLSLAYGQGERGAESQIRITHSAEFKPSQIKDEMYLDEEWTTFSSVIHQLATRKVDLLETGNYFREIFYPDVDDAVDLSDHQVKRLAEITRMSREAPGQGLESARGTAWGLLNTVTYQVDHAGKQRDPGSRLDSSWFGYGNTLKRKAWNAAVNLIDY